MPPIRFKINNSILEVSLQSGEKHVHHKLSIKETCNAIRDTETKPTLQNFLSEDFTLHAIVYVTCIIYFE